MNLLPLFAALILGLPASLRAEEVILTGPPIWDSAPLIALAAQQPLAADGITFTFRPWTNPETLRKELASGRPVVAMAPVLMAPLLQARGMKGDLLAASVTGGNLWLIGRGSDLDGPEALSGLKITMPFEGNLPDLMLRRILGTTAWQPLYTGAYPASMQMLLAGKADLALLAEPMASAALAADPTLRRRSDLCPLWQKATGATACPPGGALLASPDLPARGKIVTALETAHSDIATTPGQAHALLAGFFPELSTGPGASAFAGITASLLVMPADAAPLRAFYGEIFDLAPQAIGGTLPGPEFYASGIRK